VQDEKVGLRENIAKMEAEYARQLETWRRKLDLARRDFEAKAKAVEEERDEALSKLSLSSRQLRELLLERQAGVLGSIRRLFDKKEESGGPPSAGEENARPPRAAGPFPPAPPTVTP